jgi:hypothetical protein
VTAWAGPGMAAMMISTRSDPLQEWKSSDVANRSNFSGDQELVKHTRKAYSRCVTTNRLIALLVTAAISWALFYLGR